MLDSMLHAELRGDYGTSVNTEDVSCIAEHCIVVRNISIATAGEPNGHSVDTLNAIRTRSQELRAIQLFMTPK